MGLSEALNPIAVWRERFRWLTPYYVASGPLAFVMAYAYDRLGVLGLAAFALPPAFMMVSVRQYISHTSTSVEEIRRHNTDLQQLFDFAGGLAARAHDSAELRAYAETRLSAVLGAETHITRSRQPAASRSSPGARRSDGWRSHSARRVTSSGSASATRSSLSSRPRSRARIWSTRCGSPTAI